MNVKAIKVGTTVTIYVDDKLVAKRSSKRNTPYAMLHWNNGAKDYEDYGISLHGTEKAVESALKIGKKYWENSRVLEVMVSD